MTLSFLTHFDLIFAALNETVSEASSASSRAWRAAARVKERLDSMERGMKNPFLSNNRMWKKSFPTTPLHHPSAPDVFAKKKLFFLPPAAGLPRQPGNPLQEIQSGSDTAPSSSSSKEDGGMESSRDQGGEVRKCPIFSPERHFADRALLMLS